MSDLADQLAAAEAEVARLKARAASATCRELGSHDWKSVGGSGCCCEGVYRGCSLPVYECTRCGDCDYGDNDEAAAVRRDCEQTA